MRFEEALIRELETITALGNRIYPLGAPEAVKKNGVPYLIFASSEGLRNKSLDGYLQSKEIRGEINVITANYSDLKAITKQVVALFISFEGRQIGTDGPYVGEAEYHMPVELYEAQPALYRCVIEFSIFTKED